MDTLEEKISSLESEIEGYKIQLEGATGEDRNLLLKTINTCRETLNRWLDVKKEKALQSAGELICCSSLPLNYIKNNYAINFYVDKRVAFFFLSLGFIG
jgi:hypothetical protein